MHSLSDAFAILATMPLGPRPSYPVGTARVALRGTVSTHEWVNVLYLRLTHANPVTVNDLETITNGMADSWLTSVGAQMTTAVNLATISASFKKATDQTLDYVHTESKTATHANVLANVASCVVVNWSIGAFYRGGHPRSYMPGPAADQIVNGSNLTSAYQSAFAAAAASWLNTINALTSTNVTVVELGTVRYQSGGNWLSPPVFYPYSSASVRPILGTQRRRLTE